MTEFSLRFDKDKAARLALRARFAPEFIVRQERHGIQIDTLNHAVVTDRLNDVFPNWEYRLGEPFTMHGACWIRIEMTVGGLTRVEYGEGKTPKEAVSDAIKRGAMRFGVGIDLWFKEELPGYTAEDVGAGTGGASDAGDSTWGALGAPQVEEPVTAPAEEPAVTSFEHEHGDEPATPDQWARLLALEGVGGSNARAVTRINRANGTSYVKTTVKDATVAEVARAIAGEKVSA